MCDVRLWVSTRGRIRFVSHLDLFRTLQRAVRRARIPLWYTEGFNPHPYISFLLALSLTVESDGEPVDIRLTEELPFAELKDRLNAVFPEGLRVEAVAAPVCKPGEIAFARYAVLLDPEEISAAELTAALESGALACEKSGKKNGKKVVRSVDVSSMLKSFSVAETPRGVELTVVLPAGSVTNLNPVQLLEAVSAFYGRTVTARRAVRTRLLREDLSDFR